MWQQWPEVGMECLEGNLVLKWEDTAIQLVKVRGSGMYVKRECEEKVSR